MILLINNSVTLRKTLEEYLNFYGFQVITANDGLDGFKKIIHYQPTTVICDVLLQEIDGFQLKEAINNHMNNHNIPFWIYLSDTSKEIFKNESERLQADAFLHKPFEMNRILQLLEPRKLKKAG